MKFESTGNIMRGLFAYDKLELRLRKIKKLIDEETESWILNGKKQDTNYDRISSNLKAQFDQCTQYFSKNPNGTTVTLEMEKDNPFVWTIVPPLLPLTHLSEFGY